MNISFGIDIFLNRGNDVQGMEFNVPYMMERLRWTFPEIVYGEEYWARQVEGMRQVVVKHISSGGTGGEGALSQMKRDAAERGPRFEFSIPCGDKAPLNGAISRHHLLFHATEGTPEEVIAEAKALLRTFYIRRYSRKHKNKQA